MSLQEEFEAAARVWADRRLENKRRDQEDRLERNRRRRDNADAFAQWAEARFNTTDATTTTEENNQ